MTTLPRIVRWELEQVPAYPDMAAWEAERTLPFLLAWLRGSGTFYVVEGR